MEIIAVLVVIFFIYKFLNKKRDIVTSSFDQKETVDTLWEKADWFKKRVIEKCPIESLDKYLDSEREMINAAEKDFIILRERYRHNSEKSMQIAKDYAHFSEAVYDVRFAREMLDVDMSEQSFENFEERTKFALPAIREIAKRIEDELGGNSQLRYIREKEEKQSEIINSMTKDNDK